MRKCFIDNGEPFADFDYVIIDECSQCPSRLGIIAMSCAWKMSLYMNSVIKGKELGNSIIFLPKILNENGVPAGEFKSFCTGFRQNVKLVGDEYFICVSHARRGLDSGLQKVENLVSAVNDKDEFEVTYSIEEMLDSDDILGVLFPDCHDKLCSAKKSRTACLKLDKEGQGNSASVIRKYGDVYVFESSVMPSEKRDGNDNSCHIRDIFTDVSNEGFMRKADEFVSSLGSKHIISKVGNIAFQIVRLRRKES